MRITETQLRRIIREELKHADLRNLISEIDMNPNVQWDPGATRYGPAPQGWSDPGATKIDFRPGGETRIDIRPAAGATAGATALQAGAAVIGAALIGVAVGTAINYELEQRGVNSAVIDWILDQQDNTIGYTFEVDLHRDAAETGSRSRAVSFTVTGVEGMLNKSSFYGFRDTRSTPINEVSKLTMPKKPEGVFIPTEVIGKINYEDGTSNNVIAVANTVRVVPGTSIVRATLGSSTKVGFRYRA